MSLLSLPEAVKLWYHWRVSSVLNFHICSYLTPKQNALRWERMRETWAKGVFNFAVTWGRRGNARSSVDQNAGVSGVWILVKLKVISLWLIEPAYGVCHYRDPQYVSWISASELWLDISSSRPLFVTVAVQQIGPRGIMKTPRSPWMVSEVGGRAWVHAACCSTGT